MFLKGKRKNDQNMVRIGILVIKQTDNNMYRVKAVISNIPADELKNVIELYEQDKLTIEHVSEEFVPMSEAKDFVREIIKDLWRIQVAIVYEGDKQAYLLLTEMHKEGIKVLNNNLEPLFSLKSLAASRFIKTKEIANSLWTFVIAVVIGISVVILSLYLSFTSKPEDVMAQAAAKGVVYNFQLPRSYKLVHDQTGEVYIYQGEKTSTIIVPKQLEKLNNQ